MALAILGSTYTSSECIGATETIVFNCISTNNLTGYRLYFNPGLFLKVGTGAPILTTAQTAGFYFDVPGTTGGFVNMAVLPALNSEEHENIVLPTIDVTSTTTFVIDYRPILWADYEAQVDTGNFLNGNKLIKNANSNPSTLLNDIGAVYNSNRVGRMIVQSDDLAGTVEGDYFDTTVTARFWEQGLSAGVAEFTDWTLSLTRSSASVTNLSSFEDTTAEITFQENVDSPDANQTFIIIYREDGITNAVDMVNDTTLSYTRIQGAGIAGETTAFTHISSVAETVTAIGGGVRRTTFDIDSTTLVDGGRYRMAMVQYSAAGVIANAFITNPVLVVNAPNSAITDGISGIFSSYFETLVECLTDTPPLARRKAVLLVDKTLYNAALVASGQGVDFDTNLQLVNVNINNNATGVVLESALWTTSLNPPEFKIETDISSFWVLSYEFTVLPEWANLTLDINMLIRMEVTDANGVIHYDNIVYPLEMTTSDFGLTPSSVELLDINQNPITEVCDDQERVIVQFSEVLVGNNFYSAFIQTSPGGNFEEETNFEPFYLDELNTPLLEVVPSGVLAAGKIGFYVNAFELTRDVEACVGLMVTSSPTTCPQLTVTTTATITADNPILGVNPSTADIDWSIAGLGIETVTTMSATVSTVPTSATTNDTTAAATNTFNHDYRTTPGTPVQFSVRYEFKLSNGCNYAFSTGPIEVTNTTAQTNNNISIIDAI